MTWCVRRGPRLEDVMSDTVGVQLGPGRFATLGGTTARVVDDPTVVAPDRSRRRAARAPIATFVGQRVPPVPLPGLPSRRARAGAGSPRTGCGRGHRHRQPHVDDAKQRKLRGRSSPRRAMRGAGRRRESARARGVATSSRDGPEHPRLEIAPLDVGPMLRNGVWSERTGDAHERHHPASLADRVGAPARRVRTELRRRQPIRLRAPRGSIPPCTCRTRETPRGPRRRPR